MRSLLLQPWTTLYVDEFRIASLTQDADDWLELPFSPDATFWIDVTDVVGGGTVLLTLQGSPTPDDNYFRTLCAPISLSPTSLPIIVKSVRTTITASVTHWVRWQLSVLSPTSNWGATFRIHVVPARDRFFAPTDVPGCALWVRADLGVTGTANVTKWSGLSGTSLDLHQDGTATPPTWSSEIPSLSGDGSEYLVTNSYDWGPEISIFSVVQPAVVPQGAFNRIVETHWDTGYFLGAGPDGVTYEFDVQGTHIVGGTLRRRVGITLPP